MNEQSRFLESDKPRQEPGTIAPEEWLGPGELESDTFEQIAVALLQELWLAKRKLNLRNLNQPIGTGRGIQLEVDKTVYSFRPGIDTNGLVFSDIAHDADESDFAGVGILDAKHVCFLQPPPRRQRLYLRGQSTQCFGFVMRRKKKFFRLRFFNGERFRLVRCDWEKQSVLLWVDCWRVIVGGRCLSLA